MYNYWPNQGPSPCPSCGHCPHCGRGGHQWFQPYWNQPQGPIYGGGYQGVGQSTGAIPMGGQHVLGSLTSGQLDGGIK